MGKKHLHFLLLMIACCLFIPTGAKAQNTYGYSSINYDPDSDTITAYAETDPDYNTQTYYYNSHVSANIHDANGNVLAHQTGNGSVSFSISGNGSSGYNIVSGHYMLLSYYQVNVYSQCNNQYYYFAYYDYYNYQNFAESPSPDATFSFYGFFGPGPACYNPSPDDILGSSTDTDVVACGKPTGETTTAGGWSATRQMWNQTLLPATKSFSGRTVTEQDGGGGKDTCYFNGSAKTAFTAVTGGNWTINSDNTWNNPDTVGWGTDDVSYYRQQGRAPCGTTFRQRMVIDCPSGALTYATNTLGAGITSTTVSSTRAGHTESRTYP